MKINLNGLTRNLNRFGLTIKKHSPEILMVAGTVGVVTSAVMACKATLKVNDILELSKEVWIRYSKMIFCNAMNRNDNKSVINLVSKGEKDFGDRGVTALLAGTIASMIILFGALAASLGPIVSAQSAKAWAPYVSRIPGQSVYIYDDYLSKEAELIDLERKKAFAYGYKLSNKLQKYI